MKIVPFLLFFICTCSFGQCEDYDKLDLGGTYMSRTRHYLHFYSDISDTIQYCCDLNKISKYTNPILEKAKNYIINRGGENFYSKLKVDAIEVNYPDSVAYNYQDKESYILDKFDVKYWILYTYKEDKYTFGLLFDKSGNFISENMFPDIKKNPDFENYTEPCDALALVKRHKKFRNKKVDFIELTYVDELNSFCWLVKEKHEVKKIGIFNDTILSFYINSNSGQIEKIDREKITGIACGMKIRKIKGKN